MTEKFKVEKDFTQTPDVYFDSIMGTLTDGEWKVLSVIIRKTLGFGKLSDKIAMSQMLGLTGYTQRTSVLRVRKSLAEKGLISYDRSLGGQAENCTEYTLILPEGVSLIPVVNRTPVSKTHDRGVLNDMTPVSQTTPTIDNSYNKHSTINSAHHDNPLSLHGCIPERIRRELEKFRVNVLDFGRIESLMVPINQAVCLVGEDILERAIAAAAIAGGNPKQDRDKLPKNLIGLLRDEGRLRMWADRFRKPEIVPEYEKHQMSAEAGKALENLLAEMSA